MRTILVACLVLLTAVPRMSGQELMTYEEAMRIALSNSSTMRQTEISLRRSEANLNAKNAQLKSQFKLNLTPFAYSKTQRFEERIGEWYDGEETSSAGTFSIEQPVLATDGVLSLRNNFTYQDFYSSSAGAENGPSYNNNLNLNYSQPIFTYNKTKQELEELELDYENSSISYYLQSLALEKEVATAFYQLYQLQLELSIAEEELKNNQDAYNIIKNKVEGDLLALEELYQAEVNLASSRSKLYTNQVSVANAMDNFKVLIGMPLDEEFTVIAEVVFPEVKVEMQEAVQHALENRMEIRQRQIQIEQSQFSLIATKSVNEFAGTVNAGIGIGGYEREFSKIYDKPTLTPSVGVNLEVPLFDWGERKSRIKAAELSIESSEINLEDEKIDIQLNIRRIFRNLKNLKDQIEIQKKNVENAKLTYDINQERYLNGDLTGMDLNQFQTQLSNTKIALTNAQIDYKLELLNLKIQSLYDYEKNVSIVPQGDNRKK